MQMITQVRLGVEKSILGLVKDLPGDRARTGCWRIMSGGAGCDGSSASWVMTISPGGGGVGGLEDKRLTLNGQDTAKVVITRLLESTYLR
jgi:hypothetical protein